MKKTKLWISALVVCLALFLLPMTAEAAVVDSGTCGDNLTWTLTDDGTLIISGAGEMYDEQANGCPWLTYSDSIKKAIIGDGVTNIGGRAFYDCDALTTIEIPDSVTSIDWEAFYECDALTTIVIPDSVTTIGYGAFSACTALTTVEIGDSVTSIGKYAFRDCNALTTIEIPDSVTSIGVSAFYECNALTTIEIPDSVTSIGDNAFYNCDALTTAVLGDNVTSIGNNAFSECYALTAIVIPDSVTSIGYCAFHNCTALTTVEIGDSVTSIGDCAFSYCTALTTIVIPDSVTSIDGSAFSYCTALTTVEIGDGVTSIGYNAFYECTALTTVEIGDSVTTIGEGAFSDCTALTTIVIPDSVTSIGGYAFWETRSLQSVFYTGSEDEWKAISIGYENSALTNTTIQYNVVRLDISDTLTGYLSEGAMYIFGSGAISDYAKGEAPWYSYRDSITNVIFSDTVTGIGDNAFYGCSALKGVLLPKNIISIGDNAFENTTTCYFPGTEKEWNQVKVGAGDCPVVYDVQDLGTCGENIVWMMMQYNRLIINGTGEIPDFEGVFYDNGGTGYEAPWNKYMYHGSIKVIIGDGITRIGNYAFYGLWDTEYVVIPDSVTSIGDYAFGNHPALTAVFYSGTTRDWYSISFGSETAVQYNTKRYDNVTACGFEGRLKWAVLADSQLMIWGEGAMADYAKGGAPWYAYANTIETLWIEDGVTSIGDNAFYGYSALKEVVLPKNLTSIGDDAFESATTCYFRGTEKEWKQVTVGIGTYTVTLCKDGGMTGSLTWVLMDDGTLIISGSGEMQYPNGADHEFVPWAHCRKDIRKVIIGNGVTSIGYGAFYDCDALTTVEFGNSVTSIGHYAFYDCDALTMAVLGDSVTSIGGSAFYDCDALKMIVIPESLTEFAYSSFGACHAMEAIFYTGSEESWNKIYLADNYGEVTYNTKNRYCNVIDCGVEDTVVWGVTSDGVLIIRGEGDMPNYTKGGAPWYGLRETIKLIAVDSRMTSIGDYAFYNFSALESIHIPEGVTSIGKSAFEGCSAMTKIVFPGTVTSIGDNALFKCDAMQSVFYVGTASKWRAVTIGDGNGIISQVERVYLAASGSCGQIAWWTLTRAGTLTISGVGNMAYAFGYDENTWEMIYTTWGEYRQDIREVIIESGITGIAEYAFANCENLASVAIPESVSVIGSYAFGFCTSLVKVSLESVMTSISSHVFTGCTALEEIVIPDGVTSIGESAFENCYALESVTLGSSVEKIGSYAFCNCINLKEIVIPEKVTVISSGTFSSCGSLESVTLPDNLKEIGSYAFNYCHNLTDIQIPQKVTTIGDSAFYGCSLIEKITIPAGVEKIGEYAFSYCQALSKLVISDGVLEIGRGAFSYCYGLTSVEFPDGLETIGEQAFEWCTELESILLPREIDTIEANAFASCSSLTTVNYLGTENEWKSVYVRNPNKELLAANIVWNYEPPLTAPTVTLSNNTATGKIVLTWDKVRGAEKYEILRSTTGKSGTYKIVGTTTKLTYTNTSAEAGVTYYYKVRAVAGSEKGESSKAQSLLCKLGQPVLTLTNREKDGKPILTWTEIAGATEYEIYRSTTGKDDSFVRLGSTTKLTYTDSDTKTGITYFYKIKAIYGTNTAANGEMSIAKSAACKLARSTVTLANREVDGKPIISWSAVSGAEKYEVYRSTTGEADSYFLLTTTKDLSYVHTAAAPGQTYYYKVKAIHSTNVAASSALSAAKKIVCDVAQVTGLTATNVASSGKIKLTWDTVDGATHYEVWRSKSETGTYTKIYTTAGTSLTNTSTVAGVTYYYKVRAIISGNEEATGAYSSVVSRVCDCAQVTGLTATNVESSGKIKLTWNKVDGATHYELYRSTSKTGTYTKIYTTAGTSLTNTSTEAGVTYYYKVRAIISGNAEATGAYSSVVSRACDCAQVTGLTATNVESSGKIKLTWNKVDGATHYELYRSTSKTGTYKKIYTTAGTSLTNTSTEAGVTYYYKVRAIIDGKSSAAGAYSAIVSRACDCAKVTGLTATNVESSGKIKLTWNKVDGATHYELYRSTSKTGTYKKIYTTAGTSLTNTSTEAGVTYYYKVRAIVDGKASATGAYSDVVSRACDCAKVTGLTATNVASSGKIKLTWNAVAGADKYEVYRSTSKTGTYTKIYTTAGTSLTNTSTEAGVTYYYKVRAIVDGKASATGAYSEIVSRTCDLARPTVSISLNSKGKPVLTWDAVSGAVKYEVYRSTSENGTYTRFYTTTGTKYTNSSAETGVTYYYKVKAIASDSAANSAYSSVQHIESK